MIQRKLLYVGLALLVSSTSQALPNSSIAYEGQIIKPDGTPLSGAAVQFKIEIRSPDANNCLMFQETTPARDMSSSGGNFSLSINDGTASRTDTSGFSIERIFANQGSFNFGAGACASGTSYTPGSNDGRNLVVSFKDETMAGWEAIPAERIDHVPFAIEAKQVAGFGADSLLRVVNGSGDPLGGLAPLSNTQYTELMALVGGTSTSFTKAGQLGGVPLPTMATGEVLGWNGTAWVSSPAGTPGVNTVTTSMLQNNVIDSSKIASQAVGTAHLANNLSISTSGTLASAISTTRDFQLFAASPSAFYVDMKAPALSSSYTLTWPLNAGGANQVLTTDGAGNLSWTTAGGGGATGAAGGDLSGTYPNPAVTTVGTSTAAQVHSAEVLANAATPANTSNQIVKRDISGSFMANVATVNGVALNNAGSIVNLVNPAGAAYTLTLPVGMGTNGQVLTTNGGGVTSWTTVASAGGDFRADGTVPMTGNIRLNNKFLSGDGGNEGIFVNSSGNVGIGTSTPGASLQVAGDGLFSQHVNAVGLWSSTSNADVYTATSSTKPYPDTYQDNLISNSNSAVQSMSLQHFEAYSAGNAQDAYIGAVSSASGFSPAFVFGQRTGAIAYQERMRISQTGNVGIGTTSPSTPLTVSGSGALPQIALRNPNYSHATPSYRGYLTGYDNVDNPGWQVGIWDSSGVIQLGEPLANNHKVALTTSGQQRLVVDLAGNVGIGTATPGAMLDVVGPLKAQVVMTNAYAVGSGCPAVGQLATSISDARPIYCSPTNVWVSVQGNQPSSTSVGLTLDFIQTNRYRTSSNCGTMYLHNLKDGQTYHVFVAGTGGGTCNIGGAFSDGGVTSLAVHQGAMTATASKTSLLTIVVVGTEAIVTFDTGLN